MSGDPIDKSTAVPNLPAIEEKLAVLMRDHLLETSPGFTLDSNLYDAGLDSMALMQLLILIENHFGLMLGEPDLSRGNFTSIRSLAQLIHRNMETARQ